MELNATNPLEDGGGTASITGERDVAAWIGVRLALVGRLRLPVQCRLSRLRRRH